jgi:hypothetical protein
MMRVWSSFSSDESSSSVWRRWSSVRYGQLKVGWKMLDVASIPTSAKDLYGEKQGRNARLASIPISSWE